MRLSIDHYYCVGLLTSGSLDLLFLIWLQKAEPPPVSKGKCTPTLSTMGAFLSAPFELLLWGLSVLTKNKLRQVYLVSPFVPKSYCYRCCFT